MMVFVDSCVVIDAHPEMFRKKDPEHSKQSLALLEAYDPLYLPFWAFMEVLGKFSFVTSDLEEWLDDFYERFPNIVPLFPEIDDKPTMFSDIINGFYYSMIEMFRRKFFASDATVLLQIEGFAPEEPILVTWDKKHFLDRPSVSKTVRFMTPKTFLSEYSSPPQN